MLNARVDITTGRVICPACDKKNFTVFRKDKIKERIYLNHCRCANCGQLFIFKTDLLGKVI